MCMMAVMVLITLRIVQLIADDSDGDFQKHYAFSTTYSCAILVDKCVDELRRIAVLMMMATGVFDGLMRTIKNTKPIR